MKTIKLAIIGLVLVLTGCAITSAPTLTPLEIQSLQTREYAQGKDIVFDSVVSVFQDLGYIVKSANKDTGFITAESPAKGHVSFSFSKLQDVTSVSQVSATAFIEEIGKMTRVRLNFVASYKKSFSRGQTNRHDTPILNANIYENAFDRIGNAIFVRSSN